MNHSTGEAERLRRQRAALSQFGKTALRTEDLQDLLQQATVLVSHAIDVDLVKVLELLPGGEEVIVRAGVNWNPGVVGNATFGAHEASPAGYAMQTDEPVISRDTASEVRFEIPDLLQEHGVQSMVNVVIRGERGAWGVLEVDSRERRDFDEDDTAFLQNYANLLASAIDRLQSHEDLRRSAETRDVLMKELQHRSRNLLGIIRALARRIGQNSESVPDFLASFEARLDALSRTHDTLTTGTETAVPLKRVLQQELEAHGVQPVGKVRTEGPDLSLSPKAGQAIAMAFHELTTNAVKYGALKSEKGRLDISWYTEAMGDEASIVIAWREHDIKIESPPTHKGYGSELIEKALPYMLGGEVTTTFHADGLECTIRFRDTEGEEKEEEA